MPTFITKSSLGQFEQFLAGEPAKNVFVASLDERAGKVADLTAAERSAFVAAAEKIVSSAVIPAFSRVKAMLEAQLPRTKTTPASGGCRVATRPTSTHSAASPRPTTRRNRSTKSA